MKRLVLLLLFFVSVSSFGDGSSGIHAPPLNISTLDGATNGYPFKLYFQNGCLLDNHNGSFTVLCTTMTTSSPVSKRCATGQSVGILISITCN